MIKFAVSTSSLYHRNGTPNHGGGASLLGNQMNFPLRKSIHHGQIEYIPNNITVLEYDET